MPEASIVTTPPEDLGYTSHKMRFDGQRVKTVFSCDTCGKVCDKRNVMQEHVPIHSSVRNYKCPRCDLRFKHASSRARHITKRTCVRKSKKIARASKLFKAKI